MPNNNEKEFISAAGKLGYKALCFLYRLEDYLKKQKNFEDEKLNIYMGVLADNRNINKVRSRIENAKAFIAFKSFGNDRFAIEKSRADMVFAFEENPKRDFIHQRASGLNHILCRLANENNVFIGFSLNSILNSENKFIILGRIMQNIKLCKKFKAKTIVASFARKPFEMRSVHDIISLFKTLGWEKPDFLKESVLK